MVGKDLRNCVCLKSRSVFLTFTIALVTLVSFNTYACDVDDLDELLGYTMIAISGVNGSFEGADFDKPIILQNGMLFQFTEYNYSYSYSPKVAVFAMSLSDDQIRKLNPKSPLHGPITTYKLLINDHIYDVTRVK